MRRVKMVFFVDVDDDIPPAWKMSDTREKQEKAYKIMAVEALLDNKPEPSYSVVQGYTIESDVS
jgi:hypothetical protein